MFSWLLKFIEKCITGCFPSPEDVRDFIYRSDVPTKAEVDLEKYLPKVLYQGSAPSCVAHAVAHAIVIEERRRHLRKSIPSRRWIYYYARKQHSGVKTPLDGTYIRYALKSVVKLGCPPEARCEYSTRASRLNKKPPGGVAMAASSRIGLQYEWLKGSIGEKIRQALSEGHPVMFGTKVGSSLRKYKPGQVLGIPNSTDGGHAMCIIGFRRSKTGWEYKVLNSWRGREIVWMTEAYIAWRKSHDFSIITGWEKIA